MGARERSCSHRSRSPHPDALAGSANASDIACSTLPHTLETDTMRKAIAFGLLAGVIALGAPADASAQDGSDLLAVGEMAPDFALPGATRHGTLVDDVRLSDYRGETVVLAFFFRVRTRG